MNKYCAAVLFVLSVVPVWLHASSEGHFDRTLQTSGAVNLDVTTGSGDITVNTGNSSQVVVRGTIHSNNWIFGGGESVIHQVESNPPIEQNGNTIRIGYNLPEDARRHVSINYEITLPADTTLQAHSGSGNIDITGVRSQVQAQTGSGDIRARDLGRGLHAQTGSGNIRAEDVAAPLAAQTGSGGVEATLTGSGDVDVHTGSGRISVRGIDGGVRARTGSGDIEASGAVAGPWQLHSGSGNIRMALDSGAGFNVSLHTSSGSIHSELPITVQGSLGRRELTGTVKGGGPQLEASTSSGDIEIR